VVVADVDVSGVDARAVEAAAFDATRAPDALVVLIPAVEPVTLEALADVRAALDWVRAWPDDEERQPATANNRTVVTTRADRMRMLITPLRTALARAVGSPD
jgi:hypothetical protein